MTEFDCAKIEQDLVATTDIGLMKIVAAREVSRSQAEVLCRGTGIYDDGSDVDTRYRAHVDEDGEVMLVVDTDEADAREEAAAEKVLNDELDADLEKVRGAFAD